MHVLNFQHYTTIHYRYYNNIVDMLQDIHKPLKEALWAESYVKYPLLSILYNSLYVCVRS